MKKFLSRNVWWVLMMIAVLLILGAQFVGIVSFRGAIALIVCGVIVGLVGYLFMKRADKADDVRAARKKAFEREWEPIRRLSLKIEIPEEADNWQDIRTEMKRLLVPYMQDYPQSEELLGWLDDPDPWTPGMAMGILHHVWRLRDHEWAKRMNQ